MLLAQSAGNFVVIAISGRWLYSLVFASFFRAATRCW
jgi:hypothetical protein